MINKDLLTTIVTAIAGAAVAYIICGLILPASEDVTFRVLDSNIDYTIVQPDPEIFNYRAINPTVPAVVDGDCQKYDENGQCIDSVEGDEESDKGSDSESQETPEVNPEEIPEENPEPISPDGQPSGGGGESGPTN